MTPITTEEMIQRAELNQVYMIPTTRGSVHKVMLEMQKIAKKLNYTLSTQQAQVILDDDLYVAVVFVVSDKSEQVEDDGWIEWKGGECPVNRDQKIRVKFKDGIQEESIARDFIFVWRHYYDDNNIIAYKIIED